MDLGAPDGVNVIRRAVTSFVTCDKRLLDVALAAGLPADSPS